MGISGSGPTLFAFTKGEEKIEEIRNAANQIYQKIGLGVDVYFSAINTKGAYSID
jgi:homoserine kinase